MSTDYLPPNTQIVLPQPQRRSLFANILLGILVAGSLAVVLMIVKIAAAPMSESTNAPVTQIKAPPSVLGSPVVNVSIMWPTVTPKPTSATLGAIPTPIPINWCRDGSTQPGDVCVIPDPPPPTPTPLPSCDSTWVGPGDLCRWPVSVDNPWE